MSSTPRSSTPSTRLQRRVIASPRTAQDLKLRLGSGDAGASNLPGLSRTSPLTGLLVGSPSQMQSLTPDFSNRHAVSHIAVPAETTRTRLTAPPALDNVSPVLPLSNTSTSERRASISCHGRGSLPELPLRKEVPSNSVDLSAERCALSPSSTGGGRSIAMTPTVDASHNGVTVSSFTPQPASSSGLVDGNVNIWATMQAATANKSPSASKNHSKRTSASRDASGIASQAPPPLPPQPPLRTSVSSGPRSTRGRQDSSSTATTATTTTEEDHNNPLLFHLPPPQHHIDLTVLVPRTAGTSGELDTSPTARTQRGSRPGAGTGSSLSISGPACTPVAAKARESKQTARDTDRSGGPTTAARAATPAPAGAPSPNGRSVQNASVLNGNTANNLNISTPAVAVESSSTHHNSAARHRSREKASKPSRAPRLASHLLFDEDSALGGAAASNLNTGSTAPTSSLQSPAVRDGKVPSRSRYEERRIQSRGSSSHEEAHVTLIDTPTSLSTGGVTDHASPPRPTAAKFARGEMIGKGSFGTVYRGMDRTTSRIVCMKEIRLPDVVEKELQRQQELEAASSSSASKPAAATAATSSTASSDEANKAQASLLRHMDTVKRELTVLKQLNHTNIVKYLNHEVVDGCLRIYMEYVSGGSVASAVKTYGNFSEPQARALCRQLLQGLLYLHNRGIIHRDLKGDNLLLETSSELKIADFGTAKSIIASATMTANIVGTANFMAPEVLRPDGLAGTAADIWSTGCCVIEMLTGKPPLSQIPNQYTVMMTIAGSPTVPLEKYIPADNTWSPEVLDFLAQCLQVDASKRPTAAQLLRHPWLQAYAENVPKSRQTSGVPNAPACERPANSAPPRRGFSQPDSPDVATAASAGASVMMKAPITTFASTKSSIGAPSGGGGGGSGGGSGGGDGESSTLAAPHSRTHSNSSSGKHLKSNREHAGTATTAFSAPRESKSKKEKRSQSTKRRPSRDAVADEDGNEEPHGSPRSNKTTPHLQMSPSASTGGPHGWVRSSDRSPLAFAKPASVEVSSKLHRAGNGSSLGSRVDDERQQSFLYEYPPPPSEVRNSTIAVMDGSPLGGAFLPAIHGLNTLPLIGSSRENGLRKSRSQHQQQQQRLNNPVAVSREETRAYQYPSDDDFAGRLSFLQMNGREMLLVPGTKAGVGYPDHSGHDLGEMAVRYGSVAKIGSLDPTMETGVYSALDCLTAMPPSDDGPPLSTLRRSAPRKNERSDAGNK